MGEIEVTQSNTGTYTVSFECPDGEELSKTNARLLFEESTISEVIDDLNMHRGDHALLVRIAELEAERDRLREALVKLKECLEGYFGKTEKDFFEDCYEDSGELYFADVYNVAVNALKKVKGGEALK